MDQVKLAEVVARVAHFGQVDKGGNNYIMHPLTVASMVETEDEKTVALLHDVVEDTPITLSFLCDIGFPVKIVSAVDAITRREGEDRQDYLDRIASNRIATVVKIADLTHNSDLSRISNRLLGSKDINRVKRYKEEKAWLMAKLG